MNDAILGVERSVSGRRWRSRLEDPRLAAQISQQHDLPEAVGRVLAARGVRAEDVEGFLDPKLRAQLPDPSSFAGMDAAVARLMAAVEAGEKIAIFGDYDVDGATASAVLQRYFRMVGGDALIYIPDRLIEGYGPNGPALLGLKSQGVAVVVTVDCGITAFDPLAEAAAAGLDVIVVDHHMAEPRLPAAVAVVNPNRLDDNSGCGQLAAVGVAFLLVIGLNRGFRAAGRFEGRPEPDLMALLDLVALGTVCDMVPLTGINRALVFQGLKMLSTRRNVGLAALADVARLDARPEAYHLGFLLGPRVNAGGRVGKSDLGARLLATDDAEEAAALAHRLDEYNTERRAIEAAVEVQAVSQIEDKGAALGPISVAVGEGWHAGVVGIVASRLVERFRRPALVIAVAEGVGKGSGRSIPGVDLGAAIIAARQAGLLIAGGGHPAAAGLTVSATNIAALREFLADRLRDGVEKHGLSPSLGLDGALIAGAATVPFVEQLNRIGPFGAGNPEPRFAVSNCRVVRADIVGANHVRCVLADDGKGRLNAIAFRTADKPTGQALLESRGRTLHVAGHLRSDSWRGRERVQLFVDDVAHSSG
jgi:single-stranded-DNA-specific exonuclease